MKVELKGQKQVFWTIVFSVGFIVYGTSTYKTGQNSNSMMLAKAPVVQSPSRGIASE